MMSMKMSADNSNNDDKTSSFGSSAFLFASDATTNKRRNSTIKRASSSFDENVGEKIQAESSSPASSPVSSSTTTTEIKENATTGDDNDDEKSSMTEVALWVGAACLFGAGIGFVQGVDKASEYFAGYLLEQSLSVDNLFVFILVFDYFKVPETTQPKVLSYGIIGAMIMRAAMIIAGVTAIEDFEPVLLVFAGILIFSSYKLLANNEEEEEEDLKDSAIVKFCSSMIPVSEEYDGDKFWTTAKDGVTKMATPLLLVVAVIELSDVVFAVDSIPAVFGVTKDPFIVYTSNIFAICGLRSLFGFVSAVVSELEYLETSVAVVLGFIGVKMIADYAGYSMSTEASLAVVATMLTGGVAASYMFPSSPEVSSSVDE
jgi:TerC family integral membrane protein